MINFFLEPDAGIEVVLMILTLYHIIQIFLDFKNKKIIYKTLAKPNTLSKMPSDA